VTIKHLPPELRNYLETQKNAEPMVGTWIVFAVGMLVLIASIIIYVGLYRFWSWAKNLLLPINIVALIMMPLYGPSVLSGWASALSYSYALVNGGILFLVYWSPVSQLFKANGDV
jgi:hypothetical protein